MDDNTPIPVWQRIRPYLATAFAAALPGVGVAVVAWQTQPITQWFESQPAAISLTVLVIAGSLLCGLALLPTHVLSLAAGWLLGGWIGPLIAWLTVGLATALGFAVGHLCAGPHLARSFARRGRARLVYRELITASPRRTAFLIALLRLSPAAPFAATNVALAALGCRWPAYVIGSVFGLAPRVVIVSLLGAGMSELDLSRPGDTTLLVFGIATSVALIVLAGRIAKRAIARSVTSDASLADA